MEEGCHHTPSACPEQPDPSWFYVEAYLLKKVNIQSTHLLKGWNWSQMISDNQTQ